MRLQRYLAQAGVASRRKAEELIAAGSVRVNGNVVKELGTTVGEDDRVEYAGSIVTPAATLSYIVLHKPYNCVTTMSDPEGRRTVADVLKSRFGVEKTYRATLQGRLEPSEFARVTGGMKLEDGRTAEAALKVVAVSRGRSVVDLTIHEGRNRQIRRMFEAVGHPVIDLIRLRFGPITLGDLAVGDMRPANDRERKALAVIENEAGSREERS